MFWLHKTVKFAPIFMSRGIAHVINGKEIADSLLDAIKDTIKQWSVNKTPPSLTVVLVGDDASSILYVNNKAKSAHRAGIKSEILRFPSTVSEAELLECIHRLNQEELVDGVLVQLPLPDQICKQTVSESITPEKDVDGFTTANFGKLCLGLETIIPCTPLAVGHLLHYSGFNLTGKKAVVCGRSKHVGLPIALLLQSSFCKTENFQFNATTTICHRHTPHEVLSSMTKEADLIVSATGIPNLIRGDMVKKDAIVIDVGITRYFDKELKKNRFVGDVCYEEVKQIAGYITPVPGGVGPVTIAMLMKNTLQAAFRRRS